MLMANKCDAPIRCAEPVCQKGNGCVTEKAHQGCDAGDTHHLHEHHHHPQVYEHHHLHEQKKQQNQSHMTPPLPPRQMAPPNVKLAHPQADAVNARPMRAVEAPPLPFMDEMDQADSESMAQFRRRFDGGEFFLRQSVGDRAAQLSRSA